jgi:hypothetical protein
MRDAGRSTGRYPCGASARVSVPTTSMPILELDEEILDTHRIVLTIVYTDTQPAEKKS